MRPFLPEDIFYWIAIVAVILAIIGVVIYCRGKKTKHTQVCETISENESASDLDPDYQSTTIETFRAYCQAVTSYLYEETKDLFAKDSFKLHEQARQLALVQDSSGEFYAKFFISCLKWLDKQDDKRNLELTKRAIARATLLGQGQVIIPGRLSMTERQVSIPIKERAIPFSRVGILREVLESCSPEFLEAEVEALIDEMGRIGERRNLFYSLHDAAIELDNLEKTCAGMWHIKDAEAFEVAVLEAMTSIKLLEIRVPDAFQPKNGD